MEDNFVQDLPHLGKYEEANDEVHAVENEETEELQEEEGKVEIFKSFWRWLQTADGGRIKIGKTALLAVAQDPFHN